MYRTLTILGILLVALSFAACDSKSEDKSDEKTEEKLPDPYTGELSHERLDGVSDLVGPFDDWDTGLAKVKAQLGQPTLVKDNVHYWGFADAEKCTWFYVEKEGRAEYDKSADPDDFMVGTVSGPSSTDPMVSNYWKDCLEYAGKAEPETPEDPNAPGPPEDGSAVSVTDLMAGVANAPSKWLGKTVTVAGVYNMATEARDQNGPGVWVTITVGQSADDHMTTIACNLADISTAPEGVLQKTAVTAVGVVNDDFDGGLSECVLTVDVVEDGAAPAEDGAAPAEDGAAPAGDGAAPTEDGAEPTEDK